MAEHPPVVHNPDESRFEIGVDGHLAQLVYSLDEGSITLVSTRVPEELGGRGLGGALVQAAMDHASSEGLKVVARCAFAKSWLGKNYPPEAYTEA